ncbi:MAG: homoserine kinase [Gemmatimonadetes bacterium]|nr:homoserine kinase [Gemmatimonadota bacterium]MBT7861112.1 homoserine kinase [Gemmatimonadota bacterium]
MKVPASAANLGPGFDCLGLALSLYLELTVEPLDGQGPHELVLEGEGAGTLPRDESNLLLKTLLEACTEHGFVPPRLRVKVVNAIPLRRGLGSSAAAFVAGRAAGHALGGAPLDRDGLLEEGLQYEGHADNVAPSLMGGFTVVYRYGDDIAWERLEPPPGVVAVVAVPAFELSTKRSRAALPDMVSREDAVHALSHTALAVAAVATGHPELLGRAMEDRLHEPYRAPLVPGFEAVRHAATAAGALGASLSGAGPSVVALSLRSATSDVAAAMTQAWKDVGVDSRALILDIEPKGLLVEPQDGIAQSMDRESA